MKPEIEKALGIIQVWNFIPDGWKVPLGFDVLVGQAKESIALLREELERVSNACRIAMDNENISKARAEKAERRLAYQTNELKNTKDRLRKAEAKLARWRPLIEAAEKAVDEMLPAGIMAWAEKLDRTDRAFDSPLSRLLRAAIKCRAEEEKQ